MHHEFQEILHEFRKILHEYFSESVEELKNGRIEVLRPLTTLFTNIINNTKTKLN